jgi:hypothetical protein
MNEETKFDALAGIALFLMLLADIIVNGPWK